MEYAVGNPTVNLAANPTQACWVHQCANNTLSIKVDGQFVDCPANGGIITVGSRLSGGSVNCPPFSLICRSVAGFGNVANLLNETGTPAPPTFGPPGGTPPGGSPTPGVDRNIQESTHFFSFGIFR